MKQYSNNLRAEKIMGLRPGGNDFIYIDSPCEFDYHCPVCKYEHGDGTHESPWDERLEWSEYNGFLWCSVCDCDYPSALCMPQVDRAIAIFLDTVQSAGANSPGVSNSDLLGKARPLGTFSPGETERTLEASS